MKDHDKQKISNNAKTNYVFATVALTIFSALLSATFQIILYTDIPTYCCDEVYYIYDYDVFIYSFESYYFQGVIAFFMCTSIFLLSAVKLTPKFILLILNTYSVIGLVLFALASNMVMLFAGLVLIAMGVAGSCYIVPLYLHLIAPKEQKGIVCSFFAIGMVTGTLVKEILDYFLTYTYSWRYTFLILIWLYAITSVWIVSLRNVVFEFQAAESSLASLLKLPSGRKTIIVAIILQSFSVFFYESQDFGKALYKCICLFGNKHLNKIFILSIEISLTTFFAFVINKIGCRQPILISSFLMMVSFVLFFFNEIKFLAAILYIISNVIGLTITPIFLVSNNFNSQRLISIFYIGMCAFVLSYFTQYIFVRNFSFSVNNKNMYVVFMVMNLMLGAFNYFFLKEEKTIRQTI